MSVLWPTAQPWAASVKSICRRAAGPAYCRVHSRPPSLVAMIRPAPAAQPWLWSTNWIAWSAGAAPEAAPEPVAGALALAHDAAGAAPAPPWPARAGVPTADVALVLGDLLAAWPAARGPDAVAAQPPRRPAAASAAATGRTARV